MSKPLLSEQEAFPLDVTAIFRKDNTVSPFSFWTEDDEEIRIDKVLEEVSAETFKDKGCGIRYKILAREQESYLFRIGDLWYMGQSTYDMRIPSLHTRHQGKSYSGRKIIDERYDNPMKVAVDVAALCHASGSSSPYLFWWGDGTPYEIDRILGVERAASIQAGIIGLRYTIRVKSRITNLFRDDDLWFMERRVGASRLVDVHGRPV